MGTQRARGSILISTPVGCVLPFILRSILHAPPSAGHRVAAVFVCDAPATAAAVVAFLPSLSSLCPRTSMHVCVEWLMRLSSRVV